MSLAGNRYTVVVQFAPFQKTPPKKVKPDPLAGTIDDGGLSRRSYFQAAQSESMFLVDAEYQAFVKSLTEPEEPKAAEATDPTTGSKCIEVWRSEKSQ